MRALPDQLARALLHALLPQQQRLRRPHPAARPARASVRAPGCVPRSAKGWRRWVLREGENRGRVRPASGEEGGMHRVRGASGDALARGPAFPHISAPARPRRPLFPPSPKHPDELAVGWSGVGGGLVALMVRVDPWLHAIHGPRRACCRDGEMRGDTSSQDCRTASRRVRVPRSPFRGRRQCSRCWRRVPGPGRGPLPGAQPFLDPHCPIPTALAPCLLKAVRLQKDCCEGGLIMVDLKKPPMLEACAGAWSGASASRGPAFPGPSLPIPTALAPCLLKAVRLKQKV